MHWLLWVAIGLAAFVVIYVVVLRPWHMSWGATQDEKRRALPGDELVAQPSTQATHGITIDAPAAQVWPWLAQMGQGRAGFYSYDWLENLFGCDIHNVDEIVPHLQQIKVGDGVLLHPKSIPLSVTVADPQRAIVLAGGADLQPGRGADRSFLKLHTYRAFTWAFVLEEQPDKKTRLIVRVRAKWDKGVGHFFRSRMFLEPAHSIMQRKMNLGIKKRVECARVVQTAA